MGIAVAHSHVSNWSQGASVQAPPFLFNLHLRLSGPVVPGLAAVPALGEEMIQVWTLPVLGCQALS